MIFILNIIILIIAAAVSAQNALVRDWQIAWTNSMQCRDNRKANTRAQTYTWH